MKTILFALNILSIVITLSLAVVMLFVFRKERRIDYLPPLVSAFISLVMLILFILLSGARLNLFLGIPLGLFGGALGLLWGFTIRMYVKNRQVVGRHSLLLLGWCLSLVLAQVMNMFGSVLASSLGLVPLVLFTGTQVGISGNLFLRRLLIKAW